MNDERQLLEASPGWVPRLGTLLIRTIREFHLAPEHLMWLLQGKVKPSPDLFPDDAVICHVRWDDRAIAFTITVHSASYDPVADGCQPYGMTLALGTA